MLKIKLLNIEKVERDIKLSHEDATPFFKPAPFLPPGHRNARAQHPHSRNLKFKAVMAGVAGVTSLSLTGLYALSAFLIAPLPAFTLTSFAFTFFSLTSVAGSLLAWATQAFNETQLPILNDLRWYAADAERSARMIGDLVKHPLMRDDEHIFSIAKEAVTLYDSILWDFHEISVSDPEGLAAHCHRSNLTSYQLASDNIKLYSPKLAQALSSIETLSSVEQQLIEISDKKLAQEAANEREREELHQLRAREIRNEKGSIKEVETVRTTLEESLKDLKLREDIKDKSFREVKDYLKDLS